jgi:hypothetical protein
MPRCDTHDVQRASFGYAVPPVLLNQYELRQLPRYAGRLFTRIWLSIQDNHCCDAVWFSRVNISIHARIPLEKIDDAQRECIEQGLLIIRPGPLDRYELGKVTE